MTDEMHKGNSSIVESCRTAIRYDMFSSGLMSIILIIGMVQAFNIVTLSTAVLGLLSISTYALNVAEYMYQYAMRSEDKKLDRLKLVAAVLNHVAYGFFIAYIAALVATKAGYL